MPRQKYELDPHNRLIITESGKKSHLSRFRRILDGKFKIGPNNSLIYHVKTPMKGAGDKRKLPHQVKLKGRWSLTKNHDLKLTLNKWRMQQPGDKLTIHGEIIKVDSHSLFFAVTTKSSMGTKSTNILNLRGRWFADKYNRLTFHIKKEKGVYDILTFDNTWEINKKHKIVYRYEKTILKRKKKLLKTLVFSGFWNITRHNRLFYRLDLKNNYGFDFRINASTANKKSVKFNLGIGVSYKKRPVKRVIIISGKWKIKKIGLLFEVEYEKSGLHAIIFTADVTLIKKNKIRFKLKNKFGQGLGMNVVLSRKLLKGDSEAFFRFLKTKKEASIYTGMAHRW